jgi:ribosomal protein S18 acetylase RimI-like enzyme
VSGSRAGPELLALVSSAVAEQGARTRQVLPVGRFLAVIDRRTDSPWASFALPDPARWKAGPLDLREALPGLEETFSHAGRVLRFEFFEALWPGLADELARAGFTSVQRQPLYLCGPQAPAPGPGAGVTVRQVRASDPDGDLRLFLHIQAAAFAEEETARPGPEHHEVARLREELLAGAQRCCLGLVGGEPAGAGSALDAEGTCEIAGVGTLPAWRGRGVAAAVTAALAAEHFQRGGTLAWLSAVDEGAGRVYARAGFLPAGSDQVTAQRTVAR